MHDFFGSLLAPLSDLVAWILIHIHAGLGAVFGANTGAAWALSIVLLVIIIKALLIPLFVKQVHAQRKMAQHAPQLQALRKKYKNDKTRLNEETMKFYKENGVNPLGGCLPMIPQMIIFFSLFYVLESIAEWKPGVKPQYGLTVPVLQSAQKATIFGVHLADKVLFAHPSPSLHVIVVIVITVLLSAAATFMTTRQSVKRGLMQTGAVDPDNPMANTQKYMQYIVPFFSLTGLYWPYGLVIYWVTSYGWTFGQQYFMFRNWEPISPAAAPAPAAGAGGAARTAQGSARPPSGAARTAAARAGSGPAARAGSGPAGGAVRSPGGAVKPASGSGQNGSGASRPSGGGTTRAKAAPSRPAAPRTGPAARGLAPSTAAAANGSNGAAKRSPFRLGRSKPEPAPEPDVPAAKVVRQQPVRQARSKRSGKR